MSAELALAVVSVVDICIKLANKTLRICQAFRTAKKDLCDKVLLLETIWTKLEIQLVFLRGIKDHLTEELAQCHFDLLQRLRGTLLQAVSQLEAAASSIVASTSTGQGHVLTRMLQLDRWRYAVAKKGLDALMTELQCWQSLFDPSWYTIMLIGGKVLDPALQQLGQDRSRQLPHNQSPASPLDHMFALRKAIDYTINTDIRSANSIVMDETGWDFTTATSVPFSSVNVVARPKSQSLYVMEGIGTAPNTNTNTTSDAYQLCRRLQSVDPSIFGLLRCKGLLEIIDDNKTFPLGPQIVYHTPAQADPLKPPTTLRSLLLEQRPVCLSSVIALAKQLVRSVSFVHTCDLVHKNIRPDNILLFPTALAALRPLELGQAFLVGFSQFRSINMETNRLGDTAWYRNLYRHPARQGLCILERYVMQHDIYSLGVCLLEIGLWRSLVWYPSTSSSTSSTYHHPNHTNSSSSIPTPVPGYSLQLRKHLSDRDFEHAHLPGSTSWIKEDLVLLTKQTLPQRMGRLYTEIVVDCLTCLDDGNNEFGSSDVTHNKQDLIVVGIKFVERILGKIEGITL
ncbi:uncharacterized protein PODANS_7_990 [Podospora anserina S mat+]|uniref:Podospora anserina S mat+ genomic DNA chromosome 7, supercontig 3 n=1 Tax=Podospora anserina (strain S / ATCC MYA-4624 / DSM 980 / FGSC 10383) TaxID=515849 RepID=B2ANY8_PODAN|nr:uncharacterized protein PODANS_7_990 [Podospora anserina S mat+]CAP65692.1 unnamed protein product [Podospora anserina S mat+]CDP32753.1 Putative protein of unknown function [Podospora anserina S mat+]